MFEKFARIFSRQHKQTTFSDAGILGVLRVKRIFYLTGTAPYWTGPNFQESKEVQVRVRAWKMSSLPAPDFSVTGIHVQTQTDNRERFIRNPLILLRFVHSKFLNT